MGLRQYLNENPAVGTSGAVAIFVIAIVGVVWQVMNSGPPPAKQIYFYDAQANTLFSAAADKQSPIKTPAGHDVGIIAVIYACGSCGDYVGETPKAIQQDNATLAWLQKMQQRRGGEPKEVIKVPGSESWVGLGGRAGSAIYEQRRPDCGEGQTLTFCEPL
jgi:hypothetical protein